MQIGGIREICEPYGDEDCIRRLKASMTAIETIKFTLLVARTTVPSGLEF
jgi:hypothetical protein